LRRKGAPGRLFFLEMLLIYIVILVNPSFIVEDEEKIK
jgi:hypothetical protein